MNHELPSQEVIQTEHIEIPIQEPLESTKVLFDINWTKEKEQRHVDNLQHFTGFYKGTYFHNGVGQKGGGL